MSEKTKMEEIKAPETELISFARARNVLIECAEHFAKIALAEVDSAKKEAYDQRIFDLIRIIGLFDKALALRVEEARADARAEK